jgi:hypothetical protein
MPKREGRELTMPKTKKHSEMQQAATEYYLEHIGEKHAKTRALAVAGYKNPMRDQAHVFDHILTRKPIVKALKKQKVTDAVIAKKIAEGLEANHPVFDGRPDFGVRRQYIAEANKILDNYPDKRVQIDERQVILNLTGADLKGLREYQAVRGELAAAVEEVIIEGREEDEEAHASQG